MARSRKRHAISGHCRVGAGEMKEFRTTEHRRYRRAVAESMHNEDYDGIPDVRTYGDEWSSPRDGKQYHSRADVVADPDLLRK